MKFFNSVLKLQQVGEVLDGADHLRNVGVLVVVPGNDLNLSLAVGQSANHGLVASNREPKVMPTMSEETISSSV